MVCAMKSVEIENMHCESHSRGLASLSLKK